MRTRRSVAAAATAVLIVACGSGTASTDTVAEQSEIWLDRFAIDLDGPETDEARSQLQDACDEAEEWHTLRADREQASGNLAVANLYLASWVILGEICNQALFDDEWEQATDRLEEVRR